MIIKLVSCSIVLLLVISLGDALEPRNLMMKPKGTIKTIQSIEDGDTIDCVDYYQQPAFDNLMLNKSQNDNYGENRCYDLDCNNFVQNTESRVIVGSSFDYVSTIDGHQYEMELGIEKNAYGNWCVYFNGDFVGHWEGSLFTSLADRADEVVWGGEIVNEGRSGVHTTTHMGSGRFPVEGLNKSSYFRNVRVADIDRGWVDSSFDDNKVTKPLCYDLTVQPPGTDWGTYFLYGGPGLNDPQCIEY